MNTPRHALTGQYTTSPEDEPDTPLPVHQDEIMAAHGGQPTEQEAVDRGVTPASGDGDNWSTGPLSGY